MEFVMEQDKIKVEKDGETKEYDVLFTFDCEDTLKSYIGYTDHSMKNGRKNIFVSAFDPFNVEGILEDITDPKELDMINDVLMKIDEEANR
ncbi:MAG: DUF1292 domain-containing protein [Bacilli bacterium]|nr:DUF1292 domain-containing protein [Bacilli bacterium]